MIAAFLRKKNIIWPRIAFDDVVPDWHNRRKLFAAMKKFEPWNLPCNTGPNRHPFAKLWRKKIIKASSEHVTHYFGKTSPGLSVS